MERDNFNLLLLSSSERLALKKLTDFEELLNGSASLYFGEIDHAKMIKSYIEDDIAYLDTFYKLHCAISAHHLKIAKDLLSNGDFLGASLELGSAQFSRACAMENYCGEAELIEQDTNRQKSNAQRSRPDSLQRLIIDIVKKNPDINDKHLLNELEKNRGHGVIDEITEDEINYSNNGKSKDSPISGLKSRLRRAKKKIMVSLTG